MNKLHFCWKLKKKLEVQSVCVDSSFCIFFFFQICTRHPRQDAPTCSSFLSSQESAHVSLRGRTASRQRQSQHRGLRSQAAPEEVRDHCLSPLWLLFFSFICFSKKENAQNDQVTRHTKCGKKGKWKVGLRYPEAWGRSQYWHAHWWHPDQSYRRGSLFSHFFQVFTYINIHSLVFKKINTSLQNNMAVSHWGKKGLLFSFVSYQ